MCEDRQRYLKDWRFPNYVAATKKPHLPSAKGAVSYEPGASPQELECPCEQALKARRQQPGELNRAFSAGCFAAIHHGALPQAFNDRAPLALARYKKSSILVLAKARYFRLIFFLGSVALAIDVPAQTAVDVARPEERQEARQAVVKEQEKRAKQASIIEFRGEQAFKEKELRTALKEEITTIEDFGLSPARGDDLAFFLEVFYRKHGYADVNVHYTIESQNRLRLDITEGARYTVGTIVFDGNVREPSDKLFEYAVGPTRERYSRTEKRLPFVAADLQEGANLVHRFYLAEGFLDAVVDAPRYTFHREISAVDVVIPIHEGRQYFFGSISFHGRTIYDSETLRGQMLDLLQRPYTDMRIEDIPRRLQAYYKTRGYYDVKVVASGLPEDSVNGRVPVDITISAGPVYYFDGVTVSGLDRLRPSYVIKRFTKLEGKAYSPEALDERFRTLMRTGLFNVLQIKPVPVDGHLLRLDISAEEAKSKEFGFLVGYGTFEGAIGGVQWRDRDLFGYGRPLTTSVEVSQRSYKGEILYEDPFFFDTDFFFRARLAAFTFAYDGYTKFELGGRFELTRKITKYDEVGLTVAARHVKITDSEIKPTFLLGLEKLRRQYGRTYKHSGYAAKPVCESPRASDQKHDRPGTERFRKRHRICPRHDGRIVLFAVFAEGDHSRCDGRSRRHRVAALVPTVLAGIRRARRHYSFTQWEWSE